MQWTMADFGYKSCPIFHAEIVGEEGGEVLFSPLRCFTKGGAAGTNGAKGVERAKGWNSRDGIKGVERAKVWHSTDGLAIEDIAQAAKMQTLSRRGVPYYEYHGFRRELAKHKNNWCSDWDTLYGAAKENFPGPAILARVPEEKALEWGARWREPLVAVGVCGDVVLCLENGWWV